MRRQYIDGPFGQIHIRTAGPATGVPLICLHQSPLSGAMFEAAVPALMNLGYWVIAPDTPGYGQSDAPDEPIDIAGYTRAIPAILDYFNLKKAALLGHHTGAVFASHFATVMPERVCALVLNGVPILSPEERAFFASLTFAPLDLKADGSHLLAAWQQRLKASPGWTKLDIMNRYCVDTLANPERYYWAFDAVFAHDVDADICALKVPTALLTNTGEDLYEGTKRAHALRPDFAFHALEGGTHDIVDEQPDAWAGAVHLLLQEL
ncbi:MAG: alpha/beta hydrolase [Pseudomonadota bacterium]